MREIQLLSFACFRKAGSPEIAPGICAIQADADVAIFAPVSRR
jgi:hypothetical protein